MLGDDFLKMMLIPLNPVFLLLKVNKCSHHKMSLRNTKKNIPLVSEFDNNGLFSHKVTHKAQINANPSTS